MRLVILLVCCLAAVHAAELLQNPGLETGGMSWTLPAGVGSVVDGKPLGADGPVLRLAADTAGWHMAHQWSLAVPAGAKRLRLAARVRTEGIRRGANDWDQPRLMALFHDAAGNQKEAIGVVEAGDAAGWRDISGTVDVPAGAASVAFCIGLHNCSGIMLATAPSCRTVD